jgi:hypothetical protein
MLVRLEFEAEIGRASRYATPGAQPAANRKTPQSKQQKKEILLPNSSNPH